MNPGGGRGGTFNNLNSGLPIWGSNFPFIAFYFIYLFSISLNMQLCQRKYPPRLKKVMYEEIDKGNYKLKLKSKY